MAEETRPPIKAESKVSPIIEFSNGSLYPYWDLKDSGVTPYLNAIRRSFSFLNPFSMQQVPTSERQGLGIKFGGQFYLDQPYPNSAHFDHHHPSHYDPLKDARFTKSHRTDHVVAKTVMVARPIIPRFCERQITTYKRCLMANDEKSDVCQEEQNNIMSICPSWALHNLKEKKLSLLKNEAMSNHKYREVMEVGPYNKGRTVADVPLRNWSDGNRHNLRPNTLWADDRYADITQEEITAAKDRVKKRRQANPQPKATVPTYNREFEAPPAQVPLYSV